MREPLATFVDYIDLMKSLQCFEETCTINEIMAYPKKYLWLIKTRIYQSLEL